MSLVNASSSRNALCCLREGDARSWTTPSSSTVSARKCSCCSTGFFSFFCCKVSYATPLKGPLSRSLTPKRRRGPRSVSRLGLCGDRFASDVSTLMRRAPPEGVLSIVMMVEVGRLAAQLSTSEERDRFCLFLVLLYNELVCATLESGECTRWERGKV